MLTIPATSRSPGFTSEDTTGYHKDDNIVSCVQTAGTWLLHKVIGQGREEWAGSRRKQSSRQFTFLFYGMLSIPECPFSSFLLLHFSLFLPPSLNFSLSFPREPRINIRSAFVKGKHSSHPSRGCDQLCLGWSTKVFWQLFFFFFAGNGSSFGMCFASQFMGVQVLTS